MIELLSCLALGLVSVLLALSLAKQFTIAGRHGARLDQLGIVPQWKFFGQSRIATDPAVHDDLHILARRAPLAAESGE